MDSDPIDRAWRVGGRADDDIDPLLAKPEGPRGNAIRFDPELRGLRRSGLDMQVDVAAAQAVVGPRPEQADGAILTEMRRAKMLTDSPANLLGL